MFCQNPRCPNPAGDFRGIMKAHITHRQAGGRHGRMKKFIDDPRNWIYLCGICHDILDNRVKSPVRERLIAWVKKFRGWDSWNDEYQLIKERGYA